MLATGTASGAWPAFCAEVVRGVALERDVADGVAAEAVRERVRGVRRSHGLLNRTELREWLTARGLDAGDLSGVARRALLREVDNERPLPDPETETIASVLWAEVACTQQLRELAAPLALGIAAERHSGVAPPAPPTEVARVEALLAGDSASGLAQLANAERTRLAERACALLRHGQALVLASVEDSAITARCRERALDWRLIELEELHVPHEGAALEALLQVRLEDRELAELADAHGFSMRRAKLRPEDRPEALGVLRSAATGDLLGPVPTPSDDGCELLHVLRTEDADADSALRARAARELELETAGRLTAGMVSWRGVF